MCSIFIPWGWLDIGIGFTSYLFSSVFRGPLERREKKKGADTKGCQSEAHVLFFYDLLVVLLPVRWYHIVPAGKREREKKKKKHTIVWAEKKNLRREKNFIFKKEKKILYSLTLDL